MRCINITKNQSIIDIENCYVNSMLEEGCGGVRVLATTRNNKTYIFKPENFHQTINEVMAQVIIKSLNLTSIEYAYIKSNDACFGALRFIDGLNRVYISDFERLDDNLKKKYIRYLALNSLLINLDESGEIYTTQDNQLVSLDYGDAGVNFDLRYLDKMKDNEKEFFLKVVFNKTDFDMVNKQLELLMDSLSKALPNYDYRKEISTFLNEISKIDYTEIDIFLNELKSLFGDTFAAAYQEFINRIVASVKEIQHNI